MARPRILPDLYPHVPPIFIERYPTIALRAEKLLDSNPPGAPLSQVRWLALYQHTIQHIMRVEVIETGKRAVQISPELKEALRWLYRGGKHNWKVAHPAVSPNSGTIADDSKKDGQSTAKRIRKQHIPATTADHSVDITSIASQPPSRSVAGSKRTKMRTTATETS